MPPPATSPLSRMHAATATDVPPAPGFLSDPWNVMTRELKPMLREPASVLFAMVQPLVFLALFAPLLPDSSAFGGSALQWFVPGIIAMTALMGASMTGSNLTLEINTGSHERLLVSPLRRSSSDSIMRCRESSVAIAWRPRVIRKAS